MAEGRGDVQYTTHPKATPSFDVCPRKYDRRVLSTEFEGHWRKMVCRSESDLEGFRYVRELFTGGDKPDDQHARNL